MATGTVKVVVKSGTANGWTYRKFEDGTIDAWKTIDGSISVLDYTIVAGIYGKNIPNNQLPFEMSSYNITGSGHCGNAYSWLGAVFKDSTFFNFHVVTSVNGSQDFTYDFRISGTPA